MFYKSAWILEKKKILKKAKSEIVIKSSMKQEHIWERVKLKK